VAEQVDLPGKNYFLTGAQDLDRMKEYFTYVLYSDKYKRLYIGQTDDLTGRLSQHNMGKVTSTKPYKPYRIIYCEKFSTRHEAVNREKFLKAKKSRTFLKKFI